MKEKINITEYAQRITEALPKGILLNTNGDKFNSMVIGWGALGTCWSVPTFTVYVREHRYTKAQLDKTKEFTISIPLDKPVPEIVKVCGSLSGNNVDKVKEAGLTLEDAEIITTPGVKEYPITLECKVLYSQKQDLSAIPENIRKQMYPQDVDGSNPMANRDAHTAYIGQIVDAYIIR
ncbi:flavin reductase [Bilifractor sp. LCP21S3_A7]|uniref:flavin reductase n=1 Tax=Bilifractor sp. LCP21S3_A7 TaxID=3438738 RepID=UPI003F9036AB